MPDHILAIDQGTTSSRALIFDRTAQPIAMAQRELAQSYPHPGWVEQDAERIWRDVLAVTREAIASARLAPAAIAAIGITNQRETLVVWERASGTPIHPAIVWQDRRTADACATLEAAGHGARVRETTGLRLDPYFSATKLAWLLDHVPGARARAEVGALASGTIDCFLLWRLTGGRVHATDATNASRTLLYDIHRGRWCPALRDLFGIPEALLPEVRDSSARFGETDPALFGAAIPIAGIAGDQQAALIGHGGLGAGDAKATFGTGGFLLLNSGATAPVPKGGLLTTIAHRDQGQTAYALEGAIFIAGAAVKWLRDQLGLIEAAAETEAIAAALPDNGGVYLVPGFVGLGAPHWQPHARGLITGLTLDSGRAHIVRAALEAVAYQTADLMDAVAASRVALPRQLNIDGGMAANGWFCQFLADILDCTITRPATLEVTARGAAFLAGIAIGLWQREEIATLCGTGATRFTPAMPAATRAALRGGWHSAIAQALTGL